MSAPIALHGRFFDGETANDHHVDVAVDLDGLRITGEAVDIFWPAKRIVLISRDEREIRLANRGNEHARLVLDASAFDVLAGYWPDLLSGRRERRRMMALIVSLIATTGAAAAIIFLGVPAASGPLARATPKDLEIQMGENLAAQINVVMRECKGSQSGAAALQLVLDRFAEDNNVGFPIRFKFVSEASPNAFALPGGQVMATSGLIDALRKDQEAFLAVMAHELGHVRARDGLQAIYRNAGVGVALDIVTGGSGAAQQAVILAGQVNQLRHSRDQEAKADDAAAEILTKANLDPAALARAFEAIARSGPAALTKKGDGKSGLPSWLSSHPQTDHRISAAHARARKGGPPPLDAATWESVVNACSS